MVTARAAQLSSRATQSINSSAQLKMLLNSAHERLLSRAVTALAGGAVTWYSKKQTITALSSTEAEYIALSEAGREARWLRNLFQELGFAQVLPTVI